MLTKLSTYIFSLAIIFFMSALPTFAATCTWTGTTSTSWATGTNWSCGSEPGSADDVVINGNGTNAPTIDFSAGAKTINSLSLGASTTSTLTFSNANTSTKRLVVNGNVMIGASGTLTHTANTTTQTHVVNMDSANLIVSAGGTIDVSSKGYQNSAGPGQGTDGSYQAGGASYGGLGGYGSGNLAPGNAYGSSTQPVDLGSGGGNHNGNSGGLGGGLAKLTISGTSTISGSVYAKGGNYGSYASGGSGGSIWLTTGTLTGAGTISAIGGTGYINGATGGGGGGGGRIAIYYTADTSSITYQNYGGTGVFFGAAGTLYKKAAASTYGDLIVDNNNQDSVTDDRFIGNTPISEAITFNSITVQNYGYLNVTSSANIIYSTLNWSTKGIIADNGGTFDLVSGGGNLTIPATSRLLGNTTRTFTGLTVNGTLTHSNNFTTEQYKLNYTINGDSTVNSGGAIDVSSRGYQISEGPGQGVDGTSFYGSGGSYGGQGGFSTYARAIGNEYGSITQPNDLGSGGGYNGNASGSGGGSLKLTVSGTLTVSGNIYAKGGSFTTSYGCGAGSGGSIWLATGTLAGSGIISVSGGNAYINGTSEGSGGGGGGRSAIYYTTDTSSITYQAYGGTGFNFAGAGTIYKKASSATYGDLLIDNNNQDPLNKYDIGKTVVYSTENFNAVTLQNYGYLSTTTDTNVTYSTLNWSTKGAFGDNGGIFALASSGNSLVIPTTSRFYENYARTYAGITANGFLETTVAMNTTGDFSIGSAGIVTHKYNTTTQQYVVDITAVNLSIASGGMIDVSSKGYQHSEGPGQGTDGSFQAGGGSYGGTGGYGSGSLASGSAYGSLAQPVDLGSGGGDDRGTGGGIGGGAVKLTIPGTSTIAGNIYARGGNYGSYASGGSGGSIWLTTGTLTGAGTISAIGGTGYINGATGGGGGGGGRIAIYYTADTSSITYQNYGGTGVFFGAAGTLYKKAAASTYGDLIVDNNNQDSVTDDRFIGKTSINSGNTFNTLTIQNYGNLNLTSGSSIVTSTLNWSTKGIITDNGGNLAGISTKENLTVPATSRLVANTARTYNNLTVNGTMTHSNNSTTEQYKINLTVLENFNLSATGAISLNAKGFLGSEGSGQGIDNTTGAGGASYGGKGGAGSVGAAGAIYGSATAPNNLGSGGGNYNATTYGGTGGGAVKLTVGRGATIDGTINVNGGNSPGSNSGGGSGGSIWLICKNLSGSGSLTANGGTGNGVAGGAGSGGRIALSFETKSANLSVQANGGTSGYRLAQYGTISYNGEYASVIDPGNGSGTDFTSLAAWQNVTQSDLTAFNTKVLNHGGIIGTVANNATVTGATSGNKAEVVHATASQILVKNLRKPLTGNLTFTNGSANVTGSGTTFTTQIAVGDSIRLDADNVFAEVASITSNTALTLISNYSGTGGSGTGSIRKYNFTKGEQIYQTQNVNYVIANDSGTQPIAVAKCRNTNNSADTTPVPIDGWVTSPDNFIKIRTDPSENYRHEDGRWNDSKYRLEVTNDSALTIMEEYVTVDGLQIKSNMNNTDNTAGIKISPTNSTNKITITQNIIKGNISGTSNNDSGIATTTTSTTDIFNNLLYDFVNTTNNTNNVSAIQYDSSGNHYLYSNTIDNCYNGYVQTAGTVIAKNNIAQDCTDGFVGTFDASSDYNISNVATDASGTHSQNGVAVSFVDKPNDDFRLANPDTIAINKGTDLTTDPNAPFNQDIESEARNKTWDVGSDEGGHPVQLKGGTRLKGGVRVRP